MQRTRLPLCFVLHIPFETAGIDLAFTREERPLQFDEGDWDNGVDAANVGSGAL